MCEGSRGESAAGRGAQCISSTSTPCRGRDHVCETPFMFCFRSILRRCLDYVDSAYGRGGFCIKERVEADGGKEQIWSLESLAIQGKTGCGYVPTLPALPADALSCIRPGAIFESPAKRLVLHTGIEVPIWCRLPAKACEIMISFIR